jgi:tetratricopeptide (TPR) repeat protein
MNPREVRYYTMLADVYDANNMPDKAFNVYQDLQKVDGQNPDIDLALYRYYHKKGDENKATEYLNKAFNNKELSVQTKIAMLQPYFEMAIKDSVKNNEALALCEKIVKAHPNEAEAYALYGDLYRLKSKDSLALVAYKTALNIDNSKYSVWQQIFEIYSNQAQNDSLVSYTSQAQEIFPNNARVYYYAGLAYMQLKQNTKALQKLQRGEMITTDNPDLNANFNTLLGDTYHATKQYTQSDSCFEKALRIHPNDAYTCNNYAYYLSLRKQNLDRAEELSKKSLKLSSNEGTFLDTYAWILFAQKKYSDALKAIQDAFSNTPKPDATMYEHLGDIQYHNNLAAEALKSWLKAKELKVESTTIDKKINLKTYVE